MHTFYNKYHQQTSQLPLSPERRNSNILHPAVTSESTKKTYFDHNIRNSTVWGRQTSSGMSNKRKTMRHNEQNTSSDCSTMTQTTTSRTSPASTNTIAINEAQKQCCFSECPPVRVTCKEEQSLWHPTTRDSYQEDDFMPSCLRGKTYVECLHAQPHPLQNVYKKVDNTSNHTPIASST